MLKRTSLSLSKKRQSDSPSSLSRFQGVSVDFLIDFNDRVLAGLEGRDVQLFECVADFEADMVNYTLSVKAGDTVSFIAEISADKWQGSIANVGIGTFNPRILRPKVREEWTVEDIREYAIKPQTKEKQNVFLETMQKRHVGKAFKGMFVMTEPRTTGFHALVNAIGLKFDKSEAKPNERFVWLDVFSTNQHVNAKNRATSMSKELLSVFGKFTERFLFYSPASLVTNTSASRNSKWSHDTVCTEVLIYGHQVTLCIDINLLASLHKASFLVHENFEQMSKKGSMKNTINKKRSSYGELSKKQLLELLRSNGQYEKNYSKKFLGKDSHIKKTFGKGMEFSLSKMMKSKSMFGDSMNLLGGSTARHTVGQLFNFDSKKGGWLNVSTQQELKVMPITVDELYWADLAKKEAKKATV